MIDSNRYTNWSAPSFEVRTKLKNVPTPLLMMFEILYKIASALCGNEYSLVLYFMKLELTGNVLEDPRNASGGCFINGCSLIPPLFGENPAGASNGGGGGEFEPLRHNSHSSAKRKKC